MSVPVVKLPFSEADVEETAREFAALLRSGHVAMGSRVRAFEKAFAEFCGATSAVNVGSGTQALEIAFRALELEGSSVAVPALTFMATAFAAVAAGAKIVLVDTDPRTLQMDPADLKRKMRFDTRAVVLVHLAGNVSPDLEEIEKIAADNGAVLIEDAAHAHGASANGKPAGSLGEMGCFSFYATKVLTTAEGGMVTTSSEELSGKLLTLREHGQIRPGSNVHEGFGLNHRPSEIHAVLGLNVMARAGEILAARREASLRYDELLASSPLGGIVSPAGYLSSCYKHVRFLPPGIDRVAVKDRLLSRFDVRLAGEVYPVPLHKQPYWEKHPGKLAFPPGRLPGAEEGAARQICLPIWPGIPPESQKTVVDSLLEVLSGLGVA